MSTSTGIAIRTIISALETLASLGEQEDEPKLEFTRTGDSGAISDDIRSNLKVAQTATNLLQKILTSANAATKDLRQQLVDMGMEDRTEFGDLPDEVLTIIFEMVSFEKGQVEVVRDFSLVSRRFREIIIRIPSVWSQISSEALSAEQAELYASRATTPTIALSIARPNYRHYTEEEVQISSAHIMDMFALVNPISSRIKTLNLTFSHSDVQLLPQLRQTCTSLSLPCLNKLVIKASYFGGYSVGIEVKSFCSSWDMPSLRALEVHDVLLELRPEILSQIETCTIKVNSDERWEALRDDGYWRSDHIVDYILSFTSVKVLELAIRLLDDYDPAPLGDRSIMDTVEDLTLGFERFEIFNYQNILSVLHFPSLTKFRVDLCLDDMRNLQEALNTISFRELPESIDVLAVAVNIETKDDDDMPLDVVGYWCEKFGNLKRLSLESKRDSAHALLGFAGSVDSIQVVDPDGQTPISAQFLAKIPYMWGERLHGLRHRTAIVSADDVLRGVDHKTAATYLEQ
ncbi:hypothetical protein SCHPADRAFT_749676 [Schizopora paradoxa]|uniref:F-box domain-containing protein n=1 Tax=Schizopora paradoxa TaxID=27342 RepID=A0A0H2QYX7_9AGAM|nr:hypothetical protein SCHPADRAFT_749676 [Schizopora paradoxa]